MLTRDPFLDSLYKQLAYTQFKGDTHFDSWFAHVLENTKHKSCDMLAVSVLARVVNGCKLLQLLTGSANSYVTMGCIINVEELASRYHTTNSQVLKSIANLKRLKLINYPNIEKSQTVLAVTPVTENIIKITYNTEQ